MKIKLNPVATVTAGLVLGSTLYVANLYAQTLEYLQLNKEIQTQISAGTEVKDIILQYMNSDRDPAKLVNSLLTIPSLGAQGINEALQTIKAEADIALRSSNEATTNAANAAARDINSTVAPGPADSLQKFESIVTKLSQVEGALTQLALNPMVTESPYKNISPAVQGIIAQLEKSVDITTLAAILDRASIAAENLATKDDRRITMGNPDGNPKAEVNAFLQQITALSLVPVDVMTKAVVAADPASSDNLAAIVKAYGASEATATTVMKVAVSAGITPAVALTAAIDGGADPTKITAPTASSGTTPSPAPASVAVTPSTPPSPAAATFSGSPPSSISGGGAVAVSKS